MIAKGITVKDVLDETTALTIVEVRTKGKFLARGYNCSENVLSTSNLKVKDYRVDVKNNVVAVMVEE